MATSPTVLAGASTSPPPTAPEPVAAKIPVFLLLIAVVAGVVIATLGVGGVVYYLAHTGRLPMQQGPSAQRTAAIVPITTHALALEPLLVNLADADGSSYLRVAMTLRVADGVEKKGAKAKAEKGEDEKSSGDAVAAVRDTVLTVLGRQTADGLLAAGGKEHLKAALKTALAEHNADLKVKDIFFTDFLVQR